MQRLIRPVDTLRRLLTGAPRLFLSRFSSARNQRRRQSLLPIVALAAFAATSANAQLVNHSFEDGTTQGWGPRGSVTVSSSTAAARSGSYSLLTTGSTATWNGPSLNLLGTLTPDVTYEISGWVRMQAGQSPAELKFTVQRTDGGEHYTQVNALQTVTDSAWVQLKGNYSFTGDSATAIQIYLESPTVGIGYHLDDFTISALAPGSVCPEPLDQSGLMTDFETATREGWFARGSGSATVNVVSADAFEGAYSLAVTGRTASWNGASINTLCKMHKGEKYLISMWLKLLPGQDPAQLRVSLQAGLNGATTYHTVIGNTTVTAGDWVNLSTEYTFALDADELQLYVESGGSLASFYIDDFLLAHVPSKPIQTDIPSVKDVLADYFPVGTAVEPADTVGLHGELLLKHFNSITAGNAMKWSSLQPTEGNFNFGPADALANFARDHGLMMRGHTLIWHSQVPDWVFEDAFGNPLAPGDPAARALVIQRMETHISTVVARYSDVIDSWDVVNEVIDASQPGGLRDSRWLQLVGPEYIDIAFELAAAADPDAGLYINDYSTTNPQKMLALQNVVQGLIDRGVPVDGVGHQMHVNIEYPSLQMIRDTLELFASMGLDNQVTEFDMSVYTNSSDTSPVTDEQLIEQGYRYRDIFNLYRELSDIISSVTLWGISDDVSWLKTFPITRDDKPLLFDEDLQAKLAYWGVVDPTQLPLIPKTLRVTQGSPRLNAREELRWEAIAPTALRSEGVEGSWARFKALWEADTLYVLVDVDDRMRRGDSVEIFLDGMSFTFSGYGRQEVAGAEGVIVPSWGGYRLEAAIPLGVDLMVEDELLFDLRVSDSSTGDQASWSDIRHSQESDTSDFGTLQLMGKKKIATAGPKKINVDGFVDPAWRSARELATETFVLGNSGATAQVKLSWYGEYLYVLAHVSDPVLSKASANPWEQDSIELFIDENIGQTTRYDGDDAQYRINFDNEQSFGGAASADSIQSASRIVSGGYIVEARIRIDEANAFIGFDVQVNDDGAGDGVRSSVATWNDVSGEAYQDSSQFGAVRLLGRKVHNHLK